MNVSRAIPGIISLIGIIAFAPVVAAVSLGGGSVQSYTSEGPLDNGTIVQLVDEDKSLIGVATQDDLQKMFGVVVDRNRLPMTLTNDDIENEVFVAVSGTYNVIVSTQGGSIKQGDHLTLSSIHGIAMKAGTEEKVVFGRAASDFDGKDITIGSTVLKDVDGRDTRTVALGSIPVTIDIKQNPNEKTTKVNVPKPLERVGQAIAEKEVSPIRVYLSIAITVICLVSAIAILYSGVRNSMISIGRNPMSKKSIFRALLEIILTSVLILIIGLFAVYLLLRL